MAELRFGATLAGWGDKRRRRLGHEIAQPEIIGPGPKLVDTYATLRAWCVDNGHGLGHTEHEADRWVAAAAIRLGAPLVSHDSIFKSVEGLDLITRLTEN